jgi:hypothetical protein
LSVEIASLIIFIFFSVGRFRLGILLNKYIIYISHFQLITIATLGNKSETSLYLVFFLIFQIIPLFSYIYFLCLQTYALKIEVIINAIGLFFFAFEIVFCLLAILVLSAHEKAI